MRNSFDEDSLSSIQYRTVMLRLDLVRIPTRNLDRKYSLWLYAYGSHWPLMHTRSRNVISYFKASAQPLRNDPNQIDNPTLNMWQIQANRTSTSTYSIRPWFPSLVILTRIAKQTIHGAFSAHSHREHRSLHTPQESSSPSCSRHLLPP